MRVAVLGVWFVAVGTAACSFAPGRLTSDAAGDDAPGDAMIDTELDANLDPDGDGVLSATDNCLAIANADQHDEDADAKGDACDPCPQGGDDTDTDGDKIGDGCDPHPAIAGDMLVRFEGFGGTTVPAAWTTVPAADTSWSVSQDSLHADVNSSVNHYLWFDAGGAKTTVDVAADLVSNASAAPVLAPLVDADAAAANSWSCATRFDAGTYAVVLETTGTYATQATAAGTPALPDTYRYRARIDAGGMTCEITRGANQFKPTATATPNLTGVAIRVRDINATIHYVAVYTSP